MLFVAALGFVVFVAPLAAIAAYPERPIRFIVPAAAGNSGDISARIIVAQLGRQMGQQIVVDNRPGASGSLAMEIIAKAPPDGYTIGAGNLLTLGCLTLHFATDIVGHPVRENALTTSISGSRIHSA